MLHDNQSATWPLQKKKKWNKNSITEDQTEQQFRPTNLKMKKKIEKKERYFKKQALNNKMTITAWNRVKERNKKKKINSVVNIALLFANIGTGNDIVCLQYDCNSKSNVEGIKGILRKMEKV